MLEALTTWFPMCLQCISIEDGALLVSNLETYPWGVLNDCLARREGGESLELGYGRCGGGARIM